MTLARLRGFTLLEVMVALAVLAIALGALIKIAGQSAVNLDRLRTQTVAGWVALNRSNELLLARTWPALGISHGTREMADREWRWEVQVSETPDRDLRRLDVTVRLADAKEPLVKLSAFKKRPPR